MLNSMAEANAHWVRETLLARGPMSATQLIALAEGELYPEGHRTLWRRVDRAIQLNRRRHLIDYDEKRRRWQAFRRGGTQ